MGNSTRSVEKEEFWRLVVDEQGRSGMTARAFCRQQGISEPSFFAWRTKIRQRDAQQHDRPAAHDRHPLVPVDVLAAPLEPGGDQRGSQMPIEILTPGGYTLRVDRALAPATVTALLSAILSAQGDAISC